MYVSNILGAKDFCIIIVRDMYLILRPKYDDNRRKIKKQIYFKNISTKWFFKIQPRPMKMFLGVFLTVNLTPLLVCNAWLYLHNNWYI